MFDQLARQYRFGRRRQRVYTGIVKQHQAVVVTAKTILYQIAGNQGNVLLAALGLGIGSSRLLALGGKADTERTILERSNFSQNVRILNQRDRRNPASYPS